MPQATELYTAQPADQATLLSLDGEAAPAPGGDLMSTLPMLLIIFAIFFFLVIRPQNKARDEHKKLLAGLKKGDEVVTDGGIIGVVHKVDEGRVEVEVAPKMRMTFQIDSVKAVVNKQEQEEAS